MKKRLIKPPAADGEILFLPPLKECSKSFKADSRTGVCHQPYFFNPGVVLKFLFLEGLSIGNKEMIFLDTDRAKVDVKVPFPDGSVGVLDLVDSDRALCDLPVPEEGTFLKFFSYLEDDLKRTFPGDKECVLSNFLRFKEIVLGKARKKYFKETLAESFLEYFGIKIDHCFLSDLLKAGEFREFFMEVFKDAGLFRDIFNETLAEYRNEYKFRYKNYPFPPLEEGELPFWIVTDGGRKRCFETDIPDEGIENLTIFPRAATLTIFLRLYRMDAFIHGIGGANYEWIQDRIIERFFKKTPAPYIVLSGTFLFEGFKEREFPYFFYDPDKVRGKLKENLLQEKNISENI